MKKPTCLIISIICLVILVLGIIFVLPWFVELFQEIQQTAVQEREYTNTLSGYANIQLTAEQENLLTQLLEYSGESTEVDNSPDFEFTLSSEHYLSYLKARDGQDYADYHAYIAAMPTDHHRTAVRTKLNQFLDVEVDEKELMIWVNSYYIIREWSKTGKTQQKNGKEFRGLLDKHLIDPLVKLNSGSKGFSTHFVKMGLVSTFMIDDNAIFHEAWQKRIQVYGTQEGYLRCAIATPDEFALMRSYFPDADTFKKWLYEPFHKEETIEEKEGK